MAETRTPAEIRQSIEANRAELGLAVERLRGEVTKATDWRGQLERHRKEVIAGVFAVFALIYLVHSLSWGIFALLSDDINFVWVGYLIAGGLLLLLGGLAGFLATRFVKGGTPPTPVMAIEEGKLIKQTIETSRPAKPIGAGGRVEASDPARRN